jgi:DNA-binding transcriptional LysR family regulator
MTEPGRPLAQIDLNLLKVLDVLIEARSVTRAGERLGRTQSAVSNALGRLRRLLDDELLVRGQGGLALTPRAEALRQPLREMMLLAQACLDDGTGFDPAAAEGAFRIAMPDRLSLPLLPPLYEALNRVAPAMALNVTTADRDQAIRLLDEDRIDIAVGSPERTPSHMRTEHLFDDALVCLFRRDHPLAARGAARDLSAVLSYPHLVVSATGTGKAIFDSLLAERGLSRRAAVTVSNFSAVPRLLETSDMIGVFTRRIAAAFAASYALVTRPLPSDLAPLDHRMIWHARYDRDLRHLWLRDRIRDICATL